MLDALTYAELIELQHRRGVVARSLPAVDHKIINRLAAEAIPERWAARRCSMSWPPDWASHG
jgi:hypothetical protein